MSNVTRYECDENVNIIIFIQSYYIQDDYANFFYKIERNVLYKRRVVKSSNLMWLSYYKSREIEKQTLSTYAGRFFPREKILVKPHNTITRFIFILYEPTWITNNQTRTFEPFDFSILVYTKFLIRRSKRKRRDFQKWYRSGKKEISAMICSTKKFGFNVFFALKHVSEAAIFKLCVRKRDILTRFPRLSLDFSTTLDTNNNCTRYIRSTYSPHFRYE